MNNIQLKCENLTLGYNSKIIIENLSFSINSGDYLCIVGENGSGKTTLMKALLGLLNPISGKITKGKNFIQDEIGYLPQQSDFQKDFPASVKEIVLSGCQSRCGKRPFYNKNEKNLCETSMKKMGIQNLAKKCYRELSGGQQQRVLLARAFCAAQKMLLLDEPVTALDAQSSEEMYNLIAELNKSGITIIMISHDISSALKYASHILNISNKEKVFFGMTKDFLGVPEKTF